MQSIQHKPLLSPHQQATMPSLRRTRMLAASLARITGDPVAVLKRGDLYWTACPADLAVFWQDDLDSGAAAIVETIPGDRTPAPVEVAA